MNVEKISINPYLFFRIEDGQIIAWDYKNHNQFIITENYLLRIIELSKTPIKFGESIIDQELKSGQIIVEHTSLSKEITWGWDSLSHIFHIGTQNIPITKAIKPTPEQWVDEYLDYCENIIDEKPIANTIKNGININLPIADIKNLKINYGDVLCSRKTCRLFHGKQMPLDELSHLLYTTFGLIHGEWNDLKDNHLEVTGVRKASPSGGGLHPEEAYVVVMKVESIPAGLYHYRSDNHSLTQLQLGNFEDNMIELLWDQYYAKGMSIGIFITARLDKAWWKYKHSRAYRNVLYDIGHVSQTFLLTATALGFATWLTGAFHDTQVENFLGISNSTESILLFVGAGYGDPLTLDDNMKKQLEKRNRS